MMKLETLSKIKMKQLLVVRSNIKNYTLNIKIYKNE